MNNPVSYLICLVFLVFLLSHMDGNIVTVVKFYSLRLYSTRIQMYPVVTIPVCHTCWLLFDRPMLHSERLNSRVRVASLLLLATTRKFVLSLVCVGLQTLLSFQLPYLVISYTSRWIQVCSCFKLYASKINGTCIPSVSCYFLHLMLKSEMILQSVFFTSHDALVSLLVLGLTHDPCL